MGLDISSGRGAGVMGTLVAALVLGGFVVLYFFVFDESMAGGRSIESVIKEQREEIDRLKDWAGNQTNVLETRANFRTIAAEADQMQRKAREIKGDLDTQVSLVSRIQSEIAQVKTKDAAYRAAYRSQIRNEGKGLTYAQLKTLSGKVYQTVVVSKVDAVGMNIQHQDGTARVEFENLPPEIGEHFQYDPNEKKEAINSERDQSAAYNTTIDQGIQKAGEANNAAKATQTVDAAAEIEKLQILITQLGEEIEKTEREMKIAKARENIFNPAPFQAKIKSLQTRRATALARVESLRTQAKPR
ncbi:hypothetical protein KBB96_19515 [Luteolibacter ambystomatis]|uniref:Uncharacterized protein n=1 Tax=Luteolibacter ambystomatis TaxID=2824561 RepID=A0A975IZ27_9BACT|nr:hypothetical protein [Luteolibacter ambystomatis]QUE51031.1 hypothetical protein KBB96_19515 [Luteolibacter ambystomatis]